MNIIFTKLTRKKLISSPNRHKNKERREKWEPTQEYID
jgi:hypothetical protein